MDLEKRRRRQSLKIILSEAIMVIVVAVTVVILAFLVSGYWLNSDFEVERQGLLQVSSVPTGADVEIDGVLSSWLQRTNTSKVLPSGEHTIVLTKDGYDSWSKTIDISEGLLYRIHYPRLFPIDRVKNAFYDTTNVTAVFISDNRETMLLYMGDAATLDTAALAEPLSGTTEELSANLPEWTSLSLTTDEPEPKPVNRRNLYDFFKRPESTTAKNTVKDFSPDLAKALTGEEKLIFSKFYDDQYLTILDQTNVTVYKKGTPEPILTTQFTFLPEDTTLGHNGEFIVFSTGAQIATLDMEVMSVKEWAVDGDSYGWLDDDMLYSVKDSELFVYDFDGLNRRSLVRDVSEHFPVFITGDKWLYYFSNNHLMREALIAG